MDSWSNSDKNNSNVFDVGGFKMASTVLSSFCNFIEITPRDLNFAASGRKTLAPFDFSDSTALKAEITRNIAHLQSKESSEISEIKIDFFICPATFHLMDTYRYEGVNASAGINAFNMLEFLSEFSKDTAKLFFSVPIAPRTFETPGGVVYSTDDFISLFRKYGFELLDSCWLTDGAINISHSLQAGKLHDMDLLEQVDFVDPRSSYVIGFFTFQK